MLWLRTSQAVSVCILRSRLFKAKIQEPAIYLEDDSRKDLYGSGEMRQGEKASADPVSKQGAAGALLSWEPLRLRKLKYLSTICCLSLVEAAPGPH